jgi:hypothetical protein
MSLAGLVAPLKKWRHRVIGYILPPAPRQNAPQTQRNLTINTPIQDAALICSRKYARRRHSTMLISKGEQPIIYFLKSAVGLSWGKGGEFSTVCHARDHRPHSRLQCPLNSINFSLIRSHSAHFHISGTYS